MHSLKRNKIKCLYAVHAVESNDSSLHIRPVFDIRMISYETPTYRTSRAPNTTCVDHVILSLFRAQAQAPFISPSSDTTTCVRFNSRAKAPTQLHIRPEPIHTRVSHITTAHSDASATRSGHSAPGRHTYAPCLARDFISDRKALPQPYSD